MKLKILIIIIFTFSTCILFCSNKNRVVIDVLNRNPVFRACFDTTSFTKLNLVPTRHICNLDKGIYSKVGNIEILNDSTQRITIDQLETPMFMNFLGIPLQFLVTNGDSIEVVLDSLKDTQKRSNFKLTFKGKNEENYNFRWFMTNYLAQFKYNESESISSILNRIDDIQRINEQKIRTEYHSDSDSFILKVALDELSMNKYDLLSTAIRLRTETSTSEDYAEIKLRYFTEQFSSNSIGYKLRSENIYSSLISAGGILFSSLYLDYKNSQGAIDWNKAIKDTINKYFDKELYQYLLVSSFNSTLHWQSDSIIDQWYRTYHDSFEDPQCRKRIEILYTDHKIIGKPLPQNVLSEEITIIKSGKKGTLFDLIAQSGRKTFIYNWATWDKKSIATIKRWQQEKGSNQDEDNIYNNIYLSLDQPKDLEKVKSIAHELGITGECYLLDKELRSSYTKHLRLKTIPLSINFDENGLLLNYK